MSTPRPLLVVADFLYPNYAGGSARLVHSFLKGLDENGLDFRVVTRPAAGVYGAGGQGDKDYQKWKAAGKVLEASPFSPKLLRALKWCSRDTTLNVHHPVLGLFFLLLAPSKRFAYFFHGPWHEEYKAAGGGGIAYRIKRALQVLVLRRSDRIFVLSRHFGDIAAGLMGSPDKVSIISPMLETRGRPGERDQRQELRKKWSVPDSATVLFTSRRLTPRTGVLELAEMFGRTFGQDRLLVVVGKGELQARLEAEIRDRANVRYLNYVSDEALRELMLLSDVYVLPTLSLEGFGMVILEAMDAGLPVVASETSGGAREFLETLDPGLIFSMSNGESLRKAVELAGTFPPEKLVQIAARFDLKTQSRKWHNVFSG